MMKASSLKNAIAVYLIFGLCLIECSVVNVKVDGFPMSNQSNRTKSSDPTYSYFKSDHERKVPHLKSLKERFDAVRAFGNWDALFEPHERRDLQAWTPAVFCARLQQQATYERAQCTCNLFSYEFECRVSSCLTEIDGCGNTWYCTDVTAKFVFSDVILGQLIYSSYRFDFENDENLIYDAYTFTIPNPQLNVPVCRMTWIQNGIETECNSCRVCRVLQGDETADFDCSNVAPRAISNGCEDVAVVFENRNFIDVCIEDRRKQKYTPTQFDQLCDRVIPTDFAYATCDCLEDAFSIECRSNYCNSFIAGCGQNDICMDVKESWVWNEELGLKVHSSEYEFDQRTRGLDYDSFRFRMFPESYGGGTCELFWTVRGEEYMCNSCEICDIDDISANFDCDNVQRGADTNGCAGRFEIFAPTDPFFDICLRNEEFFQPDFPYDRRDFREFICQQQEDDLNDELKYRGDENFNCECDENDFVFSCEINECSPIAGCNDGIYGGRDDEEYCGNTKFRKEFDRNLQLTAVQYDHIFDRSRDIEFESFNFVMRNIDEPGVGGECEMYWKLDERRGRRDRDFAEKKCRTCEVCDMDAGLMYFDCENVQKGASTEKCVSVGAVFNATQPIFDVCSGVMDNLTKTTTVLMIIMSNMAVAITYILF